MPRVLFVNDYPMVMCAGLCDAREYPSQHLWGMRDIGQRGFDVDYFPVERRFAPGPGATTTLRWGPDLGFVEGVEPDGELVDVLAAGKTNRDFARLVEACRGARWSAAIYCARGNVDKLVDPPPNPQLERRMGQRAREIARETNIQTFTRDLARQFEQMLRAPL